MDCHELRCNSRNDENQHAMPHLVIARSETTKQSIIVHLLKIPLQNQGLMKLWIASLRSQ